jgi:hypothetical protein
MSRLLDATCRGCQAKITWATVQATGRRIPLEAYPEAGGNVVVVQAVPLLVRVLSKGEKPPAGTRTYRAHFATCPARPGRPRRPPAGEQVELAFLDEERER